MGAAGTAGLSCGLYQIENVYSAMKHISYHPEMEPLRQAKKRQRWQAAIKQVLTR